VRIDLNEITRGVNDSTRQEIVERRPLKRLTDLLLEIAETSEGSNARGAETEEAEEKADSSSSVKEKEKEKEEERRKKKIEIEFKFLLKPKELRGEGTSNFIKEVVFDRCELIGEPHRQTAKETGEEVTLPCDLLLTSVGYKTLPIDPNLPFNFHSHTIPHSQGRVVMGDTNTSETKVMKGVYVTGWCKRGPSGIIGTNITDAKETVGSLLQDIQKGELRGVEEQEAQRTAEYLMNCKSSRQTTAATQSAGRGGGGDPNRVVGWDDVLRLDRYERSLGQGKVPAKPREKVITVEEMLLKMDELSLHDEKGKVS
jgi:NADPH-dependent glutamate synthase beta subunit-like oxidoreductase